MLRLCDERINTFRGEGVICGISGAVNLDNRHIAGLQSYIENAAVTGQLRGWDSTGLFQVNKKAGFELCKLPVQGEHFIASKSVGKRLSKVGNSLATILHNRAATKGDIRQENCHPFMHPAGPKDGEKAIVGVHNGTLYGADFKIDGKEFEVDSDYLMYRIYKEGPEKALSEVNGSWAVVWYQNDGALYVATNHDRPFYWGYIRDRNAMLMASEHGMMYWLAQRNGIELETIVAPEKDKIYKFDLHPGSELRKFEVTDVPKRIIPASTWSNVQSRGSQGNFPHNRSANTAGQDGDSSPSADQFLSKHKLVRFDSVPFSPMGAPSEKARTVEGFIETFDHDLLDARMLDTNPSVIRSMQGCDYGMVQIKGATRNVTRNRWEVIVGHPFSVVSSDPVETPEQTTEQGSEFSDLDHLIPSGMVTGPNNSPITEHTFYKLIEEGCVMCGDTSMTPNDASKMEWVHKSREPICPVCVEHQKMQSEARRHMKAIRAGA